MGATHWFISAGLLNQAANARTRAENVVNAALLAGTAGPFYALAYHLLGFDAAAVEILLCCACMLASPLLLRATGRIWAARELFLCALFFNFTWLSYNLGGIGAPTASWLITAPLVAMFLGGVASALSWLVFSCVAAIVIYLLPGAGHPLPNHPVADMALLYLACHLGLFVVVQVFALLFELTKIQGFVKLEQALDTINELAIRDELTGVHNRRYLLGLIEKEKERSDRNGRAFCLCLLDIDFFKRVNDTWGHSAGDTVLRACAGTVQGLVRGSDSFGRYGGEGFLLMLPETPAADAMALAERVRVVIEKMRCQEGGSEIALTVSIGVTEYRMGEAIGLAVGRADEALYLAKSSGRNRVVCHGQGEAPLALALRASAPGPVELKDLGASVGRMLDGVHCDQLTGLLNRRLLRDRLRHAMDRTDRNRRLVALLLLNINKFKEVNDALGYEAGDALLVQAGAIIRQCLRDCDTVARQLRHPDIAARVLEIVEATGLPTGCLDLEITEGVLIDDLDANRKVMGELRSAGVLVSIDDFGTGYSSLNYLSELPVDILKMDGLFVRRLGQSARVRPYAIAETIVAMAHRLELKVIAECVETTEQLADLGAMRCDEAQGYLFHRPLPAEQVGVLLAHQAAQGADVLAA